LTESTTRHHSFRNALLNSTSIAYIIRVHTTLRTFQTFEQLRMDDMTLRTLGHEFDMLQFTVNKQVSHRIQPSLIHLELTSGLAGQPSLARRPSPPDPQLRALGLGSVPWRHWRAWLETELAQGRSQMTGAKRT
jgi:hypothetical protein